MIQSGKSSILNAVLRKDRALTGPTPGLTRDAVAVEWTWGGKPLRLVDTAGTPFLFLLPYNVVMYLLGGIFFRVFRVCLL